VARQLPRLVSNPQSSSAWILGAIAALLVLVLGLTFVMHLQVQPTDLLLPATAVAGIAIFFLFFNGAYLGVSSQSAAALDAGQGGVVISTSGASVER
jgi:hypothetical protein